MGSQGTPPGMATPVRDNLLGQTESQVTLMPILVKVILHHRLVADKDIDQIKPGDMEVMGVLNMTMGSLVMDLLVVAGQAVVILVPLGQQTQLQPSEHLVIDYQFLVFTTWDQKQLKKYEDKIQVMDNQR